MTTTPLSSWPSYSTSFWYEHTSLSRHTASIAAASIHPIGRERHTASGIVRPFRKRAKDIVRSEPKESRRIST
ncbi:hypothetical protein EIW28_18120 [Glycomyces terrestris]|uniref:Uncharacterized protein n=1 Tax=Glycomyces terrestris TaxID=2493553 RepID=A0A426UTM3_9ACTN|nr:hypothetical protein EIW28_18120 [Glycomyces terrestris]